jgi:hypothetical protein
MGQGAPPFVSPEEAQAGALDVDAAAAQQALDALARALNASAATQPAANALAQGNPEQAAAELRQLAEAAQSLDPQTRAQLADQLQAMADQLSGAAPEVADQLNQAADNLRDPDPARVGEALEGVARLIEDLQQAQQNAGGNGEPSARTEGDTEGDTRQNSAGAPGNSTAGREVQNGASTQRLNSAGQVIQLPQGAGDPAEAGVLQGPSYSDAPPAGGDGASAFVPGEGSGSASGAGADPLSYPWRWRDVVQGYFSTR